MDPTRDNPILRFKTFWWGVGTFLIFPLLLAVIALLNRPPPDNTLEEVLAKVRYATKARIVQAQAASLSQEAITAAIPAVAEQLARSKPAAVAKPEQVVPGSPSAAKLAAAAPPASPPAAPETVPLDPAVRPPAAPLESSPP